MSETIHQASHPFVEFVQKLHNQPFIHHALERLQEECGLNPNVVLFLLWFAATKQGRLLKKHYHILEMAVQPWHECVVLALAKLSKSAARSSKRLIAKLQNLIQTEFKLANEIEQRLLSDAIVSTKLKRTSSQQLNDACYNVMYYCKINKKALTNEDQQALTLILQDVFAGLTQNEILSALQQNIQSKKIDENIYAHQLELIA